jgi:DNA-binding transcriptional ArsR family regulator
LRFTGVVLHNQSVINTATDPLSSVFGALADPTRRAILARLVEGERTVAQLAAPFAISQPAISKHLRVLEDAGIITRSRRGTARLSHLRAEPLRQATAWLAGYREYWEESFDRLDELLVGLQAASDPTHPPNPRTLEGRVP